MYKNHLKRMLDIILSVGGLIFLSPIFILLIILIKLDSPGRSLFLQRRIGRNDGEFLIYKFRTMRADTPSDIPTHMLGDPDAHITKIGRFLRRSSLDELPQILNIIKGDMSIIGPRPALWNQHDLTALRRSRGIQVLRPGLTGWAQVNGRDELEIPQKVKFDEEYLDKISFAFDIKIFLLTIKKVFSGGGIKEGR